jgi:protein-L-isoaspartate(D-aspartate) O-methyltransferase
MSFDESKLRILKERSDMVKVIQLLGVRDEKVLVTMNNVPRHLFTPPDKIKYAYDDTPLSIGFGQVMNEPVVVAYLTQAAAIKKTDTVLEIGTGLGYGAALLSKMATQVYTTEIFHQLAESARANLEKVRCTNVTVLPSGYDVGVAKHAPYDAILVTGSVQTVPETLKKQLAIGGRLVVAVYSSELEGDQLLRVTRVTQGDYREEVLTAMQLLPLLCKEAEMHVVGDSDDSSSDSD